MLIRGRISLRDDEPRLIPDTIQRLHEVREQHAERLILKLTPDMLDDEQYRRLNGTLQKYTGTRRVAIKAFPNTAPKCAFTCRPRSASPRTLPRNWRNCCRLTRWNTPTPSPPDN